tara:strand:- start:1572 stop:1697 length:126 start_codon:yes stop_codon:yes gene_type:complete
MKTIDPRGAEVFKKTKEEKAELKRLKAEYKKAQKKNGGTKT